MGANKSTITDLNGKFEITKLPIGTYEIVVSCLGYAKIKQKIILDKSISTLNLKLLDKTYVLDKVNITANQNNEQGNTNYTIDSQVIEHSQIVNIAEISSLLPGGRTSSKGLINNPDRLTLRGDQSESDSPDFGTAIEVDGIRLSNNATFYKKRKHFIPATPEGVDTRIINPDAIEKVQIIAGIPSVEYSDLTSGIVKIKTKQGLMPFKIRMASSPKQKQVSISKGIGLKNKGILNLNYNFTNSISNLASPYNSYKRNTFTAKHRKTFFTDSDKSLSVLSTIAGNIGGYNSEADPDQYNDSYYKVNAANIRGNLSLKWKINNKFISDITASNSINYTNNKSEEFYYQSSAISTMAFHGKKNGYFVAELFNPKKELSDIQILNRGFWSQTKYHDNKPMNYNAKLKIQKNISTEKSNTKIKLGGEFSSAHNKGKGLSYKNLEYTPNWREYIYSDEPSLNNLGAYIEGNYTYKLTKQQSVQFNLGVRNDYTFVKDARYSNVNAISPRFNFRHNILKENKTNFIKKLSWYTGWGKSVKLPNFDMLYTRPLYIQRMAFVSGTLKDGTTYYAHHIRPSEVTTNKSLKWQQNKQFEVGIQGKTKGLKFSIAYFNKLGLDYYMTNYNYNPISYYKTTQQELNNVKIPYEDRKYTISDSGTVTVIDEKGIYPNEILDKNEKKIYKASAFADNGSPTKRQGIEWVLDFKKVKFLRTSLRLDGRYYKYYHLKNKVIQNYLSDNMLMSNKQPYGYIGYYYGSTFMSNGIKTSHLNTNATIITHIPEVRLVVSLKLETTLINEKQYLSQMPNKNRVFPIKNLGQTFPNEGDIDNGKYLGAMYPLYYTTHENPNEKIPFAEKLIWAYKNDKNLYNDLTKMIKNSSVTYFFENQIISPYINANINVSKEIGKQFKLTFYANNFFNNLSKVSYSKEKNKKTLLNNPLVPTFSYGISLQVKF